ncbi:transcriptional regulator [Paenibacillus swuensis]|uniref:Transcriptional regulator n=1 Tax=Paenibacillus swuensis TaxID=1178515 RepID=A0A172TM97_9BACL|nr:MarR family transcriptional regulator [Paenibacillus swuensis]ANE47903.1 transcriptional regulator [Paenibacillus swuensis]
MFSKEFAKHWFKLSKDLKTHMENQLAPSITEGQLHVLEYLITKPSVKPSDLIHHLATTPAAITTILDRMEKNDLIRRERDANDRRIVWIHVTPKGESETRRGMEIRDKFIESYLNRISSHNQQLLIYLLGKVSNL